MRERERGEREREQLPGLLEGGTHTHTRTHRHTYTRASAASGGSRRGENRRTYVRTDLRTVDTGPKNLPGRGPRLLGVVGLMCFGAPEGLLGATESDGPRCPCPVCSGKLIYSSNRNT